MKISAPIGSARAAVTLCVLLGVTFTGCANYQLQGVVVEGRSPDMQILAKNDPRLNQGYGLPDAVVELTIDPNHPRSQRLSSVTTDAQGRFAVPIDVFGAGMMEYEVGLLVRCKDYRPQWHVFELPKQKKRVLVVMTPGVDSGRPNVDLIEDTLRSMPPLD